MMRDELRNHTRQELLEDIEAAHLRLAFYDSQVQESIEMESDYLQDEQMQQRVAQIEPDVLNLIARSIGKRENEKLGDHLLSITRTVVKIAVVILLVCYIGLSTAIAISPTMRIHMLTLLINIDDEHADVGLQVLDSIDVPSDWKGEYYPAFIPDGFTRTRVYATDGTWAGVEYSDSNNRWFDFDEYSGAGQTAVDTEDGKVTHIKIHDRPALLIEKDSVAFVVWAEFQQYFCVSIQASPMIAIQIARSVTRVR